MIRSLIHILMLVVCVWAQNAFAQQISFEKKAAGDKGKPIQIQSDKLLVEPEKNVAHFQGLVLARQADMQLASNAMSVFYGGGAVPVAKGTKQAGQASGIHLIEVFGNVRLRLPDKRATADYGKYNVRTGKIHLVGDVILQSTDTTLRGKEFEYDVNTKTSRLLSKASGQMVAKKFAQKMDTEILDTEKVEMPKFQSNFMTKQDVEKSMKTEKK